ncbi:MAG: DNA repair protein RecO [Rickettsiales bacterium]|jgi:DNA repair protein RecO (recombination protein O)|nr:DNA repair protein RecO [Rickettsiales bacterium]
MKIETNGIIIGLRVYGERALIATTLTQTSGVLSGIIAGAQVSKRRKMVGQLGAIEWGARLEGHLGTMRFMPERNLAALIMSDEQALAIMNSAFAMIGDFLPEREAHPDIYFATLRLLSNLPFAENKMAEYLRWEAELLTGIGYSLDLTKCAGCGGASDLTHLSPKTGRAVCAQCAAPHKDKLFTLPLGLAELGHFFQMAAEKSLPAARSLLS